MAGEVPLRDAAFVAAAVCRVAGGQGAQAHRSHELALHCGDDRRGHLPVHDSVREAAHREDLVRADARNVQVGHGSVEKAVR